MEPQLVLVPPTRVVALAQAIKSTSISCITTASFIWIKGWGVQGVIMDEPEEPEAVYIRSESDWGSDRERRSESEVVYVGTYVES